MPVHVNAYPWTYWVVGGLVVLVVGLIALAIWRFTQTIVRPKWQTLAGFYPGAQWALESITTPIDAARVAACLHKAEQLLIEHTHWTVTNTEAVGRTVQVYIKATDSWTDLWRRSVAGEQIGTILVTGKTLASLCHEMAHLCEEVIDHSVDMTHVSWQKNGIQRAVDAYETWLVGIK